MCVALCGALCVGVCVHNVDRNHCGKRVRGNLCVCDSVLQCVALLLQSRSQEPAVCACACACGVCKSVCV